MTGGERALRRGRWVRLAPMTPLDRSRAWLVTGPLGRGFAFALDFAAALRTMLARRRA